jgi:hypothetical protein
MGKYEGGSGEKGLRYEWGRWPEKPASLIEKETDDRLTFLLNLGFNTNPNQALGLINHV